MSVQVLTGDCRARLRDLPDQAVQCVVTSPPYFGLRNYNVEGQIGIESTLDAYVAELVAVFREVRRVLRDDGTVFLNLGDSYGGGKQLMGAPWRVAFALQADGWWLRSDIVWHKPNAMPESVRDRPTSAHEHIFLLTKSSRYFYNADAIAEPGAEPERVRSDRIGGANGHTVRHSLGGVMEGATVTRNARNVWTIPTQPYPESHFATFPPEIPRRCILAGSREGDTVLDLFGGAGTTGMVADRLGRNAILIELNPEYAAMAEKRIRRDAPLFAEVLV